jgi:phosphoglycerate dehydrogenase-like enzyme
VAAGSNDLAQEERLSVADGLAEDGQSRFAGRVQTVREEVMARRVGIVGIGIMGTAMMRNLIKDGFEVVGYDIAEVAMAGWSRAVGSPPLRRAMLPKKPGS